MKIVNILNMIRLFGWITDIMGKIEEIHIFTMKYILCNG